MLETLRKIPIFQDELSSSSPPSTSCPSDSDDKQGKSTPVPTPVESTIKDKLSQLPRPEPQHPIPSGLPIVSSPTLPPQLPSLPSQGFGTLPPLPAFAFRPQVSFPEALYPRPPFPESLGVRPILPENERQSASPKPERTDLGVPALIAKVKEEVITPPSSPRQLTIKQEPQEIDSVITDSDRNGLSHSDTRTIGRDYSSTEPFDSVITKGPFEPVIPKQPLELVTPKAPFDLVQQKEPFDLVTHKEPVELLTPKIEPVQSNPVSVSNASVSQTETISINSSMTSQVEVKGEGQVEQPDVEIMEEESDSDREGTLTPGPVPTPCNKEIHRSKSAL